ncbi:hypothetical protein ACRRTK_016929 [Alexandromys fortis]
MEVLRSMRIFYLFYRKKNNLSRMAVGQVALADSHGPCLPAHPYPPISLSLFPSLCPSFSLSLFLSFLPFFNTESQCVAQGDLELKSSYLSSDIEIGGVSHHTQKIEIYF